MEKRFRLRTNSDFGRVRKEGRSWSHPMVVLCALPNTLDHSRFGFSVSRHIGGAVVRNRVKRVMREAARACRGEVACGWDIILIARSPISTARFLEVKQAVESLLRRACLLRIPDAPLHLNSTAGDEEPKPRLKQVVE